jgi:hypothetical protein
MLDASERMYASGTGTTSWRPVGDGVTQHHKLLIILNLIRLLLLRTVADRGSSFQSATGPTHQLNICRFRAGDVCVQPDLRDDELIRLSDKSCHSTDQVATSETDPNVWTGC